MTAPENTSAPADVRKLAERYMPDAFYTDDIRRYCREAIQCAVMADRRAARSDQGAAEAVTLADLHRANIERQEAWCPDQKPDLSFRGNELAGEVGEACNVIKKLERERRGWVGSRDTLDHLAEELADVVICADLCAVTAGVDLQAAVVAKWNATSEKVGLPNRLAAFSPREATPARPEEDDERVRREAMEDERQACIAVADTAIAALDGGAGSAHSPEARKVARDMARWVRGEIARRAIPTRRGV